MSRKALSNYRARNSALSLWGSTRYQRVHLAQLADMPCATRGRAPCAVAGKLPATTGWQPVLPELNVRRRSTNESRALGYTRYGSSNNRNNQERSLHRDGRS